MLTFVRWILLKQKEVKWKLAIWRFADQQLMNILKHPEETEKKLINLLSEAIHNASQETDA